MNAVLGERVLPTTQKIQIVQGDLTDETTGAIVNAANAELLHGAGVAGAIVRRGGPVIRQESEAWVRKHGPLLHERPAWTSGGRLAAKYVIHAVGPIWGEGDEDTKLAAAIYGSLELADTLRLDSIALPAISTGIYGFPARRAADIMFKAIDAYFAGNSSGLQLVRIVLFDEVTTTAFITQWNQLA